MHGYVYLTIQRSNGARYIGQRRGGFDPDYLGSGRRIVRAISKHGRSDFEVSFLQAASGQPHLDAIEKLYITEARELYPRELILNIADGGLHTTIDGKPFMTGRRHSAETRARMSTAKKGNRNNMAGIRLVGALNPMFGRRQSAETRQRISAALTGCGGPTHGNRGKIRSAETRAKISASKKRSAGRQTKETPCASANYL
jgi:group I intron endonuclease